MITLDDLLPNERVRLLSFGRTHTQYRQKLLSFGLTIGVELQVVRVAPLGCPVQVDVRGTSLMLRKEEARFLEWERL